MIEAELKTRRVFFAIRLSKPIATSVTESLAPFKMDLKGSWTHPDDFHVTLKFLGDIDSQQLAPLAELGTAVAAQHTMFDLSLGSWGFFIRRNGPQVLWLGVDAGLAQLSSLAAAFERKTHELGFTPETRPYTPHITLARVRMRSAMLEKYLQESSVPPPQGQMQATHIELMETAPSGTPGQARYVCLQSMPLLR